MDIDRNASLAYALDLWADWLRSDFGEIRRLWYPSRSVGLECRKSVTEDAFEDLEDEVEGRIVIVVNTAVGNLPPAYRAALEMSLGLLNVCRVRNAEEMATEARARVWRALCAEGCGN